MGNVAGWGLTTAYGFFRSTWLIVAGASVYIIATGLRGIIDHFKETIRKEDEEAATAQKQQQKDLALIQHLQVLLGHWSLKSPNFRATILLPENDGAYITPRYRFQFGGDNRQCNSRAKFPRGQAFAGFAWEEPRTPFGNPEPIGPFKTDEEFRAYYKTVLNLPDDLVSALSGHMRKVRSIFCLGLVDSSANFLAVLSVDSTLPNAFDNVDVERLEALLRAIEITLESK